MKFTNIIKSAFLALVAVAGAAGCASEPFDEITELNLDRCLEPMNLKARVNSQVGDVVTFSWDVAKDAESYVLEVYNDEAMTDLNFKEEDILPDQVPYVKQLSADLKLYFRVKAVSSKRKDSHWAVFGNSVKTFAVKDNLFLAVTGKTMNSISVSWSKEVSDYKEVDHIEYGIPGSEVMHTYKLTAADIENAAATISGEGENALSPATEYEVVLYYLTARRGQVNVWTQVDPSGMTEVSTLAALQNALTTPGAKIFVKMEGSPYAIGVQDLKVPVSLYGESAADGSKPVLAGEFQFRSPLTKGAFHFEDLDLSGEKETYGFVIQLHKDKKDFAEATAEIESITFRNCIVREYSKGLLYEWDQTMNLGELTFDSCDILDINTNNNGGDVIDMRKASTISKLNILNNTIVNGMRTFLRIDEPTTIGDIRFENNTIQNLNPIKADYNVGILGFQSIPSSFSFKNNLILNMAADAAMGGAATKYKGADDLSINGANNWYYNVPATYFTDKYSTGKFNAKMLSTDPCFNSKGGYFNLDPDSEVSGQNVGASKWWTPYAEQAEDLTMNVVEGSHTWNLADAKLFSGTIKKEMVREDLYINASEAYAVSTADGMLNFQEATRVNRKNFPLEGYLAFKVNAPGSVLIKPSDPSRKGNHVLVGVGPVAGGTVTVKGGASTLTDQDNAQKIIIKDITEESLVYIWVSGPVSIEKLAWSTDVTPVNTALKAPVAAADPAVVTAREATDVVISWEAVPGAGSYSVVFSGKTYPVEEGTSYTIPGGTVSMLDPGSYTAQVYANPSADDIYNTESEAGTAAFAVLSAGGEEGGEFVVKNLTELNNALLAGKSEITLAPGDYNLADRDGDGDGAPDGSAILQVTAPLALKGQDGARILGGFKLSGQEVGTFSLKNLTVDALANIPAKDESGNVTGYTETAQGIFIDLDNSAGVKADAIVVENVVVKNFAKSVIYASNNADKFDIATVSFKGLEVYSMGTGQGVFDLRNGKIGTFNLEESTVVGGRDFLRIDATVTISEIFIRRNTLYNLNDPKNANGVLCVRSTTQQKYVVSQNIFASILKSISGRTTAAVPAMSRNAWYNIGEDFYTGCITAEIAVANNGFVLAENPFKDAAGNDFTLVNNLAKSCGVGAPKWNPSAYIAPSETFTVKDTTELFAAIDAGKTDLTLAAGDYKFEKTFLVKAGMRLHGEAGTKVSFSQLNLDGGDLGTVIIEGIEFTQHTDNNFLNVAAECTADKIVIRNCTVDHVKKSVFYDNVGATVGSLLIQNVLLSGLQGGQGTLDIRKGAYTTVTVEDCTVMGGRDFIRADAGRITGSAIIRNNLFDGCCIGSGNGILYVRSTPETYLVYNNLFLNETGSNTPLGKATGVTVPTFSKNWYYNCTASNFWNDAFTQELGTANGGVLEASPVADATSGDYTLTSDALKGADIGPARWNPSAPALRIRKR
ncbi:MAG: DUF4957 domain-containing protein [Bacteroidales bacterium]|nr:DUF4957 domain-containing protein [Bacteroidales bacterium]